MIHPVLSEYKAIAFAQGGKMYYIGYNAAMEAMPQILEDIAALKRGVYKRRKQ